MDLDTVGLPTRLLDWTFSPFIAAHFATATSADEEAIVWAVDCAAGYYAPGRASSGDAGDGGSLDGDRSEHGDDAGRAGGVRPRLYTVGHSTRSPEEVLALLAEPAVRLLVDVRTYPSSRRHPQFNQAALAQWLPAAGVAYRHLPGLGGRRAPAPESANGGWKDRAFRGYADHMRSSEFRDALAELEAAARARPAAIMCAEAVWWRCHRRLIADALVAHGWRVEHLGVTGTGVAVHELTPFAVVQQDGAVAYPPPQPSLLDS